MSTCNCNKPTTEKLVAMIIVISSLVTLAVESPVAYVKMIRSEPFFDQNITSIWVLP